MPRHTCVVWSLAEGVKIEQVSEMLGHASIQITYHIYDGLLDLRDPTVARAIATAMTADHDALILLGSKSGAHRYAACTLDHYPGSR